MTRRRLSKAEMRLTNNCDRLFMTTSQPNLLELAKQGNGAAIATLMNRHLQPQGITARASLKDGCLRVVVESIQVPEQQALVAFIQKGVLALKVPAIRQIKIYGRRKGENSPTWDQLLELSSTQSKVTTELTKITPRPAVPRNKEAPQSIASVKRIGLNNRSKTAISNPQRNIVFDRFRHLTKKQKLVYGFALLSIVVLPACAGSLYFYQHLQQSSSSLLKASADFNTSHISDRFNDGIKQGKISTKLAQAARSERDWDLVAESWKAALEIMDSVALSSPNYKAAQENADEYRKNLMSATEQKSKKAQMRERQEQRGERISKLKADVEDAINEKELAALKSGVSLSEGEADRQQSAAEKKRLSTELILLKEEKAKNDEIRSTALEEDLKRIDYAIEEQKKIIASGQPSLIDQPIPSELYQEMKSALEEFESLGSQLKVGLNYGAYSERVSILRIALDRLERRPEASSLAVTMKLETAFERHKAALDKWTECISSKDRVCSSKDRSFFWTSARDWVESAQKDFK